MNKTAFIRSWLIQILTYAFIIFFTFIQIKASFPFNSFHITLHPFHQIIIIRCQVTWLLIILSLFVYSTKLISILLILPPSPLTLTTAPYSFFKSVVTQLRWTSSIDLINIRDILWPPIRRFLGLNNLFLKF